MEHISNLLRPFSVPIEQILFHEEHFFQKEHIFQEALF